ncbi:TFIIB-type zinc ribbon-containing protein [Paraburkholderia oxyphila]|uniref:TFIIB-type zinc ribbon-containing protein n=1 Tax=Paraburkholderia oxyphila TaxID=614212 RepID=UPI0004811754|nr:zf-TFIIB domain-containing protein [Paraburkholderia oxyphila]
MKCPNCPDTTLAISERQGVELDYCPQCRGVWLDRGELDRLIERAVAASSAEARRFDDGYGGQHGGHRAARHDDHGARRSHERNGDGRRHKSWLRDLLD